jgi:hypothetical protein
MEQYSVAMRLAAYAVERSRMVRAIMRTYVKIRELSHDMVRFDEEDDDDDEAEYHEVQTKSKAFMDKKCVLEEHVEKDGYGDVTFITMKGSKAILDEDRLERFLAAANITG